MRTRKLLTMIALAAVAMAAGCASKVPTPAPGGPAGNLPERARTAPGLYEVGRGTIEAIGVLVYVDLEGGFWAIRSAEGADTNIAVIANGTAYAATLQSLEGRTVVAEGTHVTGATIRMAGPEIEITAIREQGGAPY